MDDNLIKAVLRVFLGGKYKEVPIFAALQFICQEIGEPSESDIKLIEKFCKTNLEAKKIMNDMIRKQDLMYVMEGGES